VARGGDFWGDGAPEEAAGAKAVDAGDGGAAVAVAFDVDGARADRDAE
jgi:hypothetical protein